MHAVPQKVVAPVVKQEQLAKKKSASKSPQSERSMLKNELKKTLPSIASKTKNSPAKPELPKDSSVPKKPLTPFLLYHMDRNPSLRKQFPHLKLVDLSKLIGEEWKNLSDIPRKKFYQQAEKDQVRYKKEMDELVANGYFINQKGENSRDLFKPTYGPDVVQPKKPSTAYIFFSTAQRRNMKQPSSMQDFSEQTKQIGLKWNQLTDKQKAPYF